MHKACQGMKVENLFLEKHEGYHGGSINHHVDKWSFRIKECFKCKHIEFTCQKCRHDGSKKEKYCQKDSIE